WIQLVSQVAISKNLVAVRHNSAAKPRHEGERIWTYKRVTVLCFYRRRDRDFVQDVIVHGSVCIQTYLLNIYASRLCVDDSQLSGRLVVRPYIYRRSV